MAVDVSRIQNDRWTHEPPPGYHTRGTIRRKGSNEINPAEGYGIKYEGSFLEKSQSGCVQNFCHFVCLHHFWA